MVDALRLSEGDVFAGDFEVRRLLARGGMGSVYVVVDRTCGEERALKVLIPELALDEETRRRFAQEARIGRELESPYLPRTYRAGIDEASGVPWIAMELLRGRDLRAYVTERGALPIDEARSILEQLGAALSAAHAQGLVHRDLKPENVFLEETGGPPRVKLLDFGVAKMIDVRRTSALGTAAIGSPLWMAPEQTSKGGRIAPATDVFALGLLAFYVLTGRIFWRTAHDNSGVGGLVREMMIDDPVPASVRARELAPEVQLPPGFDEWFARAVARDSAARHRDAGEAIAELQRVLASRRTDRSALAYAATMEVALGEEIARAKAAAAAAEAAIPPTDPPAERADAAPMPAIPGSPGVPATYDGGLAPAPRRTWAWLLAIIAAGLAAACLSGLIVWVVLTITGPSDESHTQTPQVAQGLHAGHTFRGTYVCAGVGTVSATLRIDSVSGRRVRATLGGEGRMPTSLEGQYRRRTRRLILRTTDGTGEGFDGHVSAAGDAYRGQAISRGCQQFSFVEAP